MSIIRTQALEAARAHVGVKGQPAFLTTESVVNIVADIYEAREERLKGALRAAGVHERLVNEIADGG